MSKVYDVSKVPSLVTLTNPFDYAIPYEFIPFGTQEIEANGEAKFIVDDSEYLLVSELRAERLGLGYSAEAVSPGPEPKPVDPEIDSVTVKSEELTEPVSAKTKVATVSVSGGTEPYTYAAGGGTDDDKFTIESEEIKAKEQLNNGTYKIKVKVADSKQKEKTSDEVTITVKPPKVTSVVQVRDGSLKTYDKHVSDLQENVVLSEDAKFTGNIKYVEDFPEAESDKHHWLAIHINKDNLQSENVKVGFDGSMVEPDKNDWNYNFSLDEEKKQKPLQVEVDGKILYKLDLTALVLLEQ